MKRENRRERTKIKIFKKYTGKLDSCGTGRPLIPESGRQKQEDPLEFKGQTVYTVHSLPAMAYLFSKVRKSVSSEECISAEMHFPSAGPAAIFLPLSKPL